MKTTKDKVAKYARMYALGIWGILSLLYIAGEPIDEQMPFSIFCLLKIAGLVSLGICYYVGAHLHRAGLLPETDDDNDCEI